MKEKTYLRMTKKRPLRGLRLFKQKYLTKQRLYSLLAKIKLVREVKTHNSFPYYNNDLIGKVTMLDENISTDRGTFNLSYRAEAKVCQEKWYYESLFGKLLYTVKDEEVYHLSVGVRSECLSFLVKLDPFTSCLVHREKPIFYSYTDLDGFSPDITVAQTAKRYDCNFFNARLGQTVHLNVYSEGEIDIAIKELVQRVRYEIANFIESRSEDINERLTGIKCDGEFHTKDGKRLIPNLICRKCGRPVFESSVEGYTAQCLFCDEDLYSIEVHRVDPKTYEDIYEFNKKPLQKILSERFGFADYLW